MRCSQLTALVLVSAALFFTSRPAQAQVFVAPRPVVVAPSPVFVAPAQVVIARPPVVVARSPVVVSPGWVATPTRSARYYRRRGWNAGYRRRWW